MGHAKRMKFSLAVHLFLLRENQVLLSRRYQTGYEDGNYSVIAGHVDGNEDVYAAMQREAKEEAGLILERNDLQIVQVMHRKHRDERIDYFLVCKNWQGKPVNQEPEKCDELKWVDIDNLPSNTVDYIRAAIDNYKAGISFSLFGWE